ncbi:MAG: F0F1 ATP synthase subunit delta [Candidatus Pelethousia sp.]|nr:F0F1 ATP synthase subunit delta [Candidatus Pelethousia sp.]
MRYGKLSIAGPMENGDILALQNGFSRLIGEPVDFEVSREESLIGGFIAYMDGRVYDMSLRTQLKSLRKHLQEG